MQESTKLGHFNRLGQLKFLKIDSDDFVQLMSVRVSKYLLLRVTGSLQRNIPTLEQSGLVAFAVLGD